MKPVFRLPTEADLQSLARRMRPMDVVECRLLGNTSPIEALREGVAHSEWALAAEINGEVVAVFGLVPASLLSDEASPWMLSAIGIERYARSVVSAAKPIIEGMAADYQRLHNMVHADNRTAIRFLKWCGFSFGEPMNLSGEPFLPFEMRMA